MLPSLLGRLAGNENGTRASFPRCRLVAIRGRLVYVEESTVLPAPAAVPKETTVSQPPTTGRNGDAQSSERAEEALHPLAQNASRRRVCSMSWPPPTLAGLKMRSLFHTCTLERVVLTDPATEKALVHDSEDDLDHAWKAGMDAQRLETIGVASSDAFFMALWSSFVEAAPLWSDGGTGTLLQDFVAARCGTVARAGLLPQATEHVRLLYTQGLIDVEVAADCVGLLADECMRIAPAEGKGVDKEVRGGELEVVGEGVYKDRADEGKR